MFSSNEHYIRDSLEDALRVKDVVKKLDLHVHTCWFLGDFDDHLMHIHPVDFSTCELRFASRTIEDRIDQLRRSTTS
jgi:hypothetical protein